MTPQFAIDRDAAKNIGIPVKRFRKYVKDGILPGPCTIGQDRVYDLEALAKAIRGEPWGFDGKDWS